jgi:phage terminase large subunit-like protein
MESDLLKGLSLDSKKELARFLLMKQKVKEAKALENWRPWEPEQGNAWRSTARSRLVIGGNRSGKTELGAVNTAHMFMGTHPHRPNRMPIIIKVAAMDFPNAIKNVILPKLFKYVPKQAIRKIEKNQQGIPGKIIGINDSVIDLMSYDQDVTKYEGFDADEVWFDEPPPEAIYDAMRRGLVDREGCELFTMTPLYEPWIYNRIWVKAIDGSLPNTECFVLPTINNPHIPPSEIEAMRATYTEEQAQVRLEGRFLNLMGLIYSMFDHTTHVVPFFDWPRMWPVYMCIDPHPRKPHAVTWIGVTDRGQKVIIDEMKINCDIMKLAEEILRLEGSRNYKIVDRLVDTSIVGVANRERIDQRNILNAAGIRCRFPKKYDNVISGIELVQQMLTPRLTNYGTNDPDLLVRENCKGHIKEFMGYIWDSGKGGRDITKEKPRKIDDDYMDNVRYICSVNPVFERVRKPVKYHQGLETYGAYNA